ncbi:PTS N-acetylgalactosamine transporter subunit IIB [Senegalia sp. (in: firmicutes)]|uniref:PTS N-acetylgalactosamine transporter subunit IIB n=1 Tax=Senegalia sp. (in: firmicutes) TaxID=1924098 RepID=UPI003F99A9ED
MANILLTRIDNRLVHGQVGVTWTSFLGANLVLVANDKVAQDEVRQNLMDMVLPDTVQTRFFTLQKTIDVIHKAADRQKIFIVVETPQDVLTLVKGGVPIKEVNIGNMHYAEGKEQLSSTISVDEDDKKTFKELNELGVTFDMRKVPDDKRNKDILDMI